MTATQSATPSQKRPRTFRIRQARSGDLDAVLPIEKDLFAPDDWSRDTMGREIDSEHTHYLVAVSADPAADSEIVAYAGVLAPSRSTDADIQTVAVRQDARGLGLGRELVRRLVGAAAAQGAREVFLEVRSDNPVARGLYERLGFTELGVRPGYYRDGADAIVMRLRHPEPLEQNPTDTFSGEA